VIKDLLELQAYRGILVLLVLPEPLVLQETGVLLDPQVLQVSGVIKALLVQQVLRELLVLLV